jgi:hypothetical protein
MTEEFDDTALLIAGTWRGDPAEVVCGNCGRPRAVSFERDGLVYFRACQTCRVYTLKRRPAEPSL